ncbi:hypothetical protein BGZ94_005559 [Podila epigama]|nr:hypothetical protein BGZ94_005559 [Podila epigama]
MAAPYSNDKVQNRRNFLAKYGSGSKAYFKKEGLLLTAIITIVIVGAGCFALSGVSLSIGYLFLLVFIGLVLGITGSFLTYHYKLTQAHKTMAYVSDTESNFHNGFDRHNIDPSWNDAPLYVPPTQLPPVASVEGLPAAPAAPVQAATRL